MSRIGPFEGNVMEANFKSTIIDQAKLLYGRTYPQGHTWSVIPEEYIERVENSGKVIWGCTVYIIVYPTPGSLRDRVIVCKKVTEDGPLNTLKALQLELQEKIGENEWQ
ncbi:hypothetical protein HBH56_032020 [Parastagonospora nodorum]|nr:hypothetical protein HBH56_032020 [Parastagonospora nodorum]QRD00360.1 hypothetical protein JI435_072210 [Parastagonospora nodorum SN15]KAH3934066.1 hypothetical protein HBH54_067430 [Parastagonospora nodorum]KAH3952511.1 hypothetical protein HBH53_042620 [Parastagonospora nodorum]KAH3979969.1 hypothetical protein HBH51_053650 [Parastagonospora nodorum]